jgi:hypothetical protein
MNLDHIVAIHDTNVDWKGLKYLCWKRHAQTLTAGIIAVAQVTKIPSSNSI